MLVRGADTSVVDASGSITCLTCFSRPGPEERLHLDTTRNTLQRTPYKYRHTVSITMAYIPKGQVIAQRAATKKKMLPAGHPRLIVI